MAITADQLLGVTKDSTMLVNGGDELTVLDVWPARTHHTISVLWHKKEVEKSGRSHNPEQRVIRIFNNIIVDENFDEILAFKHKNSVLVEELAN